MNRRLLGPFVCRKTHRKTIVARALVSDFQNFVWLYKKGWGPAKSELASLWFPCADAQKPHGNLTHYQICVITLARAQLFNFFPRAKQALKASGSETIQYQGEKRASKRTGDGGIRKKKPEI